MSRRKVFHIEALIQAPKIIVPENPTRADTLSLVADLGKVVVHTITKLNVGEDVLYNSYSITLCQLSLVTTYSKDLSHISATIIQDFEIQLTLDVLAVSPKLIKLPLVR